MSWTNLTLTASWAVMSGCPAARVRPLSGISGAAELEGYLTYTGNSLVDAPITTEASLPSGTYDTSNYHTISGRCYNSTGGHLGTCEILITTDGTLSAVTLPTGTSLLYFGDIYPTS